MTSYAPMIISARTFESQYHSILIFKRPLCPLHPRLGGDRNQFLYSGRGCRHRRISISLARRSSMPPLCGATGPRRSPGRRSLHQQLGHAGGKTSGCKPPALVLKASRCRPPPQSLPADDAACSASSMSSACRCSYGRWWSMACSSRTLRADALIRPATWNGR